MEDYMDYQQEDDDMGYWNFKSEQECQELTEHMQDVCNELHRIYSNIQLYDIFRKEEDL